MKRYVMFAMAVALMVTLAACTSAPAPTPTPTGPVKIVYWRSLAGPRGEAQEELARRFNEMQDEVEVEVQFQGAYSELEQKFMAGIAANEIPDVVMLCDTCMPPFARSGALKDLAPFINGPDPLDTSKFYGTLFDAGMVDGVQYWVPFATSTPIMMYNPDMFAEAGLPGPPETWDQFFEYARILTVKEGDEVKRYGAVTGNPGWSTQNEIWSLGGEYSDEDWNTYLDSDVWINQLGKWRDAMHKDKSAYQPTSAEGGSLGYFSNGLGAMLLTSTGNVSQVVEQAQGFKPMSAYMPGGPAGRFVPSGGSGLAIPAGAPAETNAAAWKFIKFMVSGESNAYFSQMTGYMPMTDEARAVLADYLAEHPEQQLSIDQLQFVRGQDRLRGTGACRIEADKCFERIFVGNEDPAVVMRETQAAVQACLVQEGLKK